MSDLTPLYPLLFQPIYKEKIWGGRALEKLGRELPGGASTPIGESWEIADLATTSASGGGGNAEHSVVANGPLVGKTIRELMHTYGEALLGEGVQPANDGGFPLLIKFLDAKENLSVQVHPSPEYAAAHPDAHLKSEAWYVVDAEPGAVIYKGLKPGVTPEQLRAALEVNTDDAVVPLLNAIEAKAGDCHYLPSGTLHALGAGVLVAEVQTPSDTTFRVYDWGRTDRELHIEQAMSCIDFGHRENQTTCKLVHREQDVVITLQAQCEFFSIEELELKAASKLTGFHGESPKEPFIWIILQGHCSIAKGRSVVTELEPGRSVLLPAAFWPYSLASDEGCRFLLVKNRSPAR